MLSACEPNSSRSDASSPTSDSRAQTGPSLAAGAGRAGLAGSGGSFFPVGGQRGSSTDVPNIGSGVAGNTGAVGPAASGGSVAPPVSGSAGSVSTHPPPSVGSPPVAGGSAGMAAAASAGHGDAGSVAAANGETGRQVGMTAAHNAVRSQVNSSNPLPPMVWSSTLAAYAQQWADMLASTPSTCAMPMHRSGQELQAKGYGENLAQSGSRPARMTTPSFAVDGWAAEAKCWTYGTISDPLRGGGTEKCDTTCYMGLHSDGCGHYTQVIWRDSTQLGCGVSTCTADGVTYDIWICNYAPPGNIIGRAPY